MGVSSHIELHIRFLFINIAIWIFASFTRVLYRLSILNLKSVIYMYIVCLIAKIGLLHSLLLLSMPRSICYVNSNSNSRNSFLLAELLAHSSLSHSFCCAFFFNKISLDASLLHSSFSAGPLTVTDASFNPETVCKSTCKRNENLKPIRY